MYATAKGAVMTFTRSMAKELGPQGIRCNAICPGTIATSFHDRFNTPENRERMKGSYALRREGTADEVAELVRFLVIARGSLAELDTQLWIARDLGYLADGQDK